MDQRLAVGAPLDPQLPVGAGGPEPFVDRRELGKRSHPLLQALKGTPVENIGETSWSKITPEHSGPDLATQSLAAQLRIKRSEMMISELESVALRLFEERGFDEVTIEEIGSPSSGTLRAC
jgi:hypothetical protein